MRMRCKNCDEEISLAVGSTSCPSCGHAFLGSLAPETRNAQTKSPLKESKKARLRRAMTFQKKPKATVAPPNPRVDELASRLARDHERQSGLDQFPVVFAKLEIRKERHFLRFDGVEHPVEAKSPAQIPLTALADYLLPWAVARLDAPVLRATPKPCRTLTEIGQQFRTGRRPNPAGHLGPRPVGDTPLERLGDPLAQLDRIAELQRKNSPAAWAELANAWRVPGLRSAIEQAMGEIGWPKFRILLDRVDGWPDGLAAVVDRELAKVAAKPKVKRTGPVYSHDEYWLADW